MLWEGEMDVAFQGSEIRGPWELSATPSGQAGRWVCTAWSRPFSEARPLPCIADKTYMMHISTLDKIREDWQSEHIKACEVQNGQLLGRGWVFLPEPGESALEDSHPPLLEDPRSHRIAWGQIRNQEISVEEGRSQRVFPQTSSFSRVLALTVVSDASPGPPLVFG